MVPTLTIHVGDGETQMVPLKAKGALIGRVPECDVRLSSPEVSRHHARIFQDPFGRWILEDLDSGNGVWIDGERVNACALAPGKRISIGPHELVFSQEPDAQIAPDASVVTKSTILADAADIVLQQSSTAGSLSHGRMQQVDKLITRVAELVSPTELYPEICRCVASGPRQMAAVVRLQGAAESAEPELLAVHFGGRPGAPVGDTPPKAHLSRRVLRSVRKTGEVVIAGNLPSGPDQMNLTVLDMRHPRTVCAAVIVVNDDYTDALYLDIPFDAGNADTLDFVRAVAGQAAFACSWPRIVFSASRSRNSLTGLGTFSSA